MNAHVVRWQGLAKLAVVFVVLCVATTTDQRAQASTERSESIRSADRAVAIGRVMASRSREASPLARATVALHGSLGLTQKLAGLAIQDLEEGVSPRDSESFRTLILEANNTRVAYDTIQAGLEERRKLAPSREVPGSRAQSKPEPGAFDHVRRVLQLQERLREVSAAESRMNAVSILGDIDEAVGRSLQSIRREPQPMTGIFMDSLPTERPEPVSREDR